MSDATAEGGDEAAVLTERRGKVLLITLNRPDQMNSINGALAAGLQAGLDELHGDDELTAGVLTGNGRGFCSGMDLKAFAKGEDIGAVVNFFVNGSKKPLIAAVEGFALAGGLELALSCDLIVAAEGSKFGIPEVKVGLFAAGGGVIRLPSRVGYMKAMEMALTAEPIEAAEAHSVGMISRITPKGGAVDGAMELATKIAANAPLGVAASKEVIKATQGTTEADLWAMQGKLQATVFTSNDAKEGPKAFAEKRAPEWSGS